MNFPCKAYYFCHGVGLEYSAIRKVNIIGETNSPKFWRSGKVFRMNEDGSYIYIYRGSKYTERPQDIGKTFIVGEDQLAFSQQEAEGKLTDYLNKFRKDTYSSIELSNSNINALIERIKIYSNDIEYLKNQLKKIDELRETFIIKFEE